MKITIFENYLGIRHLNENQLSLLQSKTVEHKLDLIKVTCLEGFYTVMIKGRKDILYNLLYDLSYIFNITIE